MEKNRVAIVECSNYELDAVTKALEKIIENTSFPNVEGKYILLKPNVLSDAPVEKHISTNPLVVRAIIRLLKKKGVARIIVGDSPGLPLPSFKPVNCGIWSVIEDEGVEWVDFSEGAVLRTLPSSGFKVLQTHYLDDVDLVFSIAKMKTHQLMMATGCVKNMFGTVPGLNKSPMHLKAPSPSSFSRVICDIYRTHMPEYSIMDAVISMEGAGPANGTPRHTGLLLGSHSAPALDKAEALIMGYDPHDIPILQTLEKEKKGITDGIYPLLNPMDITINDFRRVEVKKRSLFSSLILPYIERRSEHTKTHLRPAPVFNENVCRRCTKCIQICPAKALELKNNMIEIDTNKCIRCYCCHEICPFNAIEVKNKKTKAVDEHSSL